MPKINSEGVPSYDGHAGVVTNAVGEQFEVNPSLDLEGERPEGYTSEPVGEFEETPANGLPGDVHPLADDGVPDDDSDDDPDVHPDNQTPAFEPKKSTPAKKTAPAADKK